MHGAQPTPDPFFIVGTERSGSNLLRLMLNAHPDVHIPHPPHVMHLLGPLEGRFGPPGAPATLERAAAAVAALVAHHIHPWAIQPDVGRLIAEASPPDLLGLTLALYEQSREHAKKARWGCKSTFMIDQVDAVLRARPGARFIWLVRDARDVAVSSRDSVFNPKHPLLVARLWARQQRQGLSLEARHPGAVYRLRYEDLTRAPEAAMRSLCAFLGLPWSDAVLRHADTPEASTIASLSGSWKNNDKAVLADNQGKWRLRLSRRDAARIVAVAEGELRALGYPILAEDCGYTLGALDELQATLGEAAGRLRVELKSMKEDKNHWRRWQRRAHLWRVERALQGPG